MLTRFFSTRGSRFRFGVSAANTRSMRRGMMTVEVVILVAFSAVLSAGLYWLWAEAPINGEAGGILKQLANLVGELFKTTDNNTPQLY